MVTDDSMVKKDLMARDGTNGGLDGNGNGGLDGPNGGHNCNSSLKCAGELDDDNRWMVKESSTAMNGLMVMEGSTATLMVSNKEGDSNGDGRWRWATVTGNGDRLDNGSDGGAPATAIRWAELWLPPSQRTEETERQTAETRQTTPKGEGPKEGLGTTGKARLSSRCCLV